jgi:hypothetical protein
MRCQSWSLASDVVRNLGLGQDESRQLDEEITGADYYQEMLRIAKEMFVNALLIARQRDGPMPACLRAIQILATAVQMESCECGYHGAPIVRRV